MFYFKSLNTVEGTEFLSESEKSSKPLDLLSNTPILPSQKLEFCDRIDSEEFEKSSSERVLKTTNRKSSYLPIQKKKPRRKRKQLPQKMADSEQIAFPKLRVQ